MTLISVLSISLGIVGIIRGWRRDNKSDTVKDASEMTTVIIKLENIASDVTEIKSETRSVKDELKDVRDKVISTENSMQAVWKWIDYFKKNLGISADEPR